MIDVENWVWVFDETKMICRCEENGVIVKIEKSGNGYGGKLEDMPIELFSDIAKVKDGEKIIEAIVKQAEKAARKK